MDIGPRQRQATETPGRPLPVLSSEKENTMQDMYQCTRCGTGWLAKRVEPRGQGWAVRVFVCNHCRYASQPGVRLSVEEAGALRTRVQTAIVPVAWLTGPGVEGLQIEELFMLLGLGPAASGSKAQKHTLALAGSAGGV